MTVQDAILQIKLRADKWDDNSLVKSFVKVGPLIPLLDSENNQIILGRIWGGLSILSLAWRKIWQSVIFP